MPVRCIARRAGTQPTITYDTNGGTGTPSPTQAATNSDLAQSITLSSTKPTKSGQSFAGWNTEQDGTGAWYQPGDTISTASDITLYALWWTETTTFDSAFAAAGKSKVSGTDYYAMQDMNASICSNVTQSPWPAIAAATTQLIDTRDNTTYTVAKLADGKCWMLDNLALDLTDSTVKTKLTSSTTNASDTSLGYLKNGGGSTSDKYATAGVANWTSSYSDSAPLVNMDSWDMVSSDALSTAGGWKIGGYYNYCAASAGSYCYNYSTIAGTTPDDATEDICPKGWRLPTSNTSGEFAILYGEYNNYTNFRNAFHLPLSGYFYGGSANYQGSLGYFWSSTQHYGAMYYLRADKGYIDPSSNNSRYYGSSVRCVAGS